MWRFFDNALNDQIGRWSWPEFTILRLFGVRQDDTRRRSTRMVAARRPTLPTRPRARALGIQSRYDVCLHTAPFLSPGFVALHLSKRRRGPQRDHLGAPPRSNGSGWPTLPRRASRSGFPSAYRGPPRLAAGRRSSVRP